MIKKLTEKDIDRLDDILFDMGDKVMDLESVDGFFCFLSCSPRVIAPKDYLPILFGGELEFEDEHHLEETMGLIFSYSNAVSDKLKKQVKKADDVYFPYCIRMGEEDIHGRLWAIGFMAGVSIFCDSWKDFLDDKKTAQLIMPMMAFAGQGQDDPELKTDPIPEDKQPELLFTMFYCLHEIYDFFKDDIKKAYKKRGLVKDSVDIFQSPATSLNIGRNDPCHCGSEKKFKKCCLNKEQEMIH